MIATVEIFNGKTYKILEVEREKRALSTLILSGANDIECSFIIRNILSELVNNNGMWAKNLVNKTKTMGIGVVKAKHSNKNIRQ